MSLPDIDPKSRATAINALLSAGKIDLFKSETGLLYRETIQCCVVSLVNLYERFHYMYTKGTLTAEFPDVMHMAN